MRLFTEALYPIQWEAHETTALEYLTLFTSIPEEFEPQDLAKDLPGTVRTNSESGKLGEWTATIRTSDPLGELRIHVESCGKQGEDLHYHFSLQFQINSEDDDSPDSPFDNILSRIGDCWRESLNCYLTTRATFSFEKWDSLIGLPRTASGLVPGIPDDTIVLAGVELDLRKTSMPLDYLDVSTSEDVVRIIVYYKRELDFTSVQGNEILREASELSRTFVIEKEDDSDEG